MLKRAYALVINPDNNPTIVAGLVLLVCITAEVLIIYSEQVRP